MDMLQHCCCNLEKIEDGLPQKNKKNMRDSIWYPNIESQKYLDFFRIDGFLVYFCAIQLYRGKWHTDQIYVYNYTVHGRNPAITTWTTNEREYLPYWCSDLRFPCIIWRMVFAGSPSRHYVVKSGASRMNSNKSLKGWQKSTTLANTGQYNSTMDLVSIFYSKSLLHYISSKQNVTHAYKFIYLMQVILSFTGGKRRSPP